MNTIEKWIKEAYRSLKEEKSSPAPARGLSEEDMACCASGLFGKGEEERFLEKAVLNTGEEEALKNSFVLSPDAHAGVVKGAPAPLVDKVKRFVSSPVEESVLDAVVEFTGDVARVIKTTGTVLTYAAGRQLAPAAVFRGSGQTPGSKVVEISKTLKSHLVDVKIAKIKKNLANLTVQIKNRKNGALSSGDRVSLLYNNRELRSSLTEKGKVEFENIKFRKYSINLIQKGEPRCVAVLSLKGLEK